MGVQNKVMLPIYDIMDETCVWSWAEVNGESGEWILGSSQHTKEDQQRAKEACLILRTAIEMEQAKIYDKGKASNETTGKEHEKKREDLGMKMLQELEEKTGRKNATRTGGRKKK